MMEVFHAEQTKLYTNIFEFCRNLATLYSKYISCFFKLTILKAIEVMKEKEKSANQLIASLQTPPEYSPSL